MQMLLGGGVGNRMAPEGGTEGGRGSCVGRGICIRIPVEASQLMVAKKRLTGGVN